VRLGLAGDTMLGRKVAERPSDSLLAPEVVAVAREADVFLLNLECCIAEGGAPWPDPRKPFFFRARPDAVDVLRELGVDCVTLANNHALDYGEEALLETFERLEAAGIAWAGAGPDLARAREHVVLPGGLGVVALADHPAEYAAGPGSPGIAFADLWREPVPEWALAACPGSLVTVHWGPNMVDAPVAHVRRAAAELVDAGATLVAGHSAHVFHGVAGRVLYDLGDFLDDYAVDPVLRNDIGLLFLVDLEPDGTRRLEAVPLSLDFCHTRLARGEDWEWARERFQAACTALGTEARVEDGRLVVTW
jgi:poly-gamma-glutamate capsule biosynthesis protein CapA/YwtB (metallophosphatase superfamily)